MQKITQGVDMSTRPDITAQLAHHDAAISGLSGRMTGVERGLETLKGEVHSGFSGIQHNMSQQIGSLASKLDRLDAAPKFDVHKIVGTVVSLSVLFGMVCGGIIYIANAQTASVIAEQKAINESVKSVLSNHEERIKEGGEKIAKVEATLGAWTTTFSKGAR